MTTEGDNSDHKCVASTSKASVVLCLDISAILDMDRLAIGDENKPISINQEPANKSKLYNTHWTETSATTFRRSWKRRYFHRPYSILKKRTVSKTFESDCQLLDTLREIKLRGDLDGMEKRIPCSLEAHRPPSPIGTNDDADIDELSEYFDHFVRVRSKMSALAESMYC